MTGRAAALRVIAAAAISIVGVEAATAAPSSGACPPSDADARIAFASDQIARAPALYPAHARLGGACLDKARETGDPSWLARARASIDRSLALQPTWEAMMLAASAAAFAHRFEDVLSWAGRAAAASPSDGPDTRATALEVEALIGLGRHREAGAIIESAASHDDGDYHLLVARGQWLKEAERHEEAAEAFDQAAVTARLAKAAPLEAWAEIAAAGELIDAGRPEEARARLVAARAIDPCRADLIVHEAEWSVAMGRPREALAALESLLDRIDDPHVDHQSFVVARGLGLRRAARRHFRRAERAYDRAIAAGEVYTIGALARLYLDAGVRADRALDLAAEDLRHRGDREARMVHQRALAALRGE